MGDLQVSSPRVDVVAVELNPPPLENPDAAAIGAGRWFRAEEATRKIIERIQPTPVSEERRMAVVEYVQKLIKANIGSQVFPFGSVPLKTYLPDGDIDLTALGLPNSDDALAVDVRQVLECEEKNKDAEFEVKDVQYIHAEVKLVKCLVQNIVVDISFNQIGGLCTLCFLEKADRLIGKNNLFKRSIILIKAWCYYESRILGAHHGLISTYALETLVLYIFHLFHSSLEGPLAVLYRFLDYYSKFDWDSYCISLNGQIPVSSLPELVAEAPENGGGELLLTKEFLKESSDAFSVPPRGLENSPRVFMNKHLNIVDPLRENNNLGRSVSKGNFFRIRSAFTYGARKLGRILRLDQESIAGEINTFFMNTLDRHGSGERPDVQDELPSHRYGAIIDGDEVGLASCELKVENHREDTEILQSPTADLHGALKEEVSKINFLSLNGEHGLRIQLTEHPSNHHHPANWLQNCRRPETDGPREGNVVLGTRLVGDAKDLATTRVINSRVMVENLKASPSLTTETCASPSGKAHYAPHLFFQSEKGAGNGFVDQSNSPKLGMDKLPSRSLASGEEYAFAMHPDPYETESSVSSSCLISGNHGVSASSGYIEESMPSSWRAYPLENSCHGDFPLGRNGENGCGISPKPSKLANLNGDFDAHLTSLVFARRYHEYVLGGSFFPNHRSSPPLHSSKPALDALRRQSMFMQMNANGLVHGPPPIPPGCYPINTSFLSGLFGEDTPKTRGTGTYFPNTNNRAYRERQSSGRGRATSNHLPRTRSNGRTMTTPEMNLVEKGNHASIPQQPLISAGTGRGKPALLDVCQSFRPAPKGTPHVNGFVYPSEGLLEFGTIGPVPLRGSLSDLGRRPESVSPNSPGSGPATIASPVQRPGTSLPTERAKQSYQLKDEEDFPPLSGAV